MTGEELKAIRERLGLSPSAFAAELGYTGNPRNRNTLIREMERGKKQVPLYIARLAWLIDRIAQGQPVILMRIPVGLHRAEGIQWPDWPGYDYDSIPDEEMIDDQA